MVIKYVLPSKVRIMMRKFSHKLHYLKVHVKLIQNCVHRHAVQCKVAESQRVQLRARQIVALHALRSQYRLVLSMGANRQLAELRVSPPITAHLIFLEFSFLDLGFSSINALNRFWNYKNVPGSEMGAIKNYIDKIQ